MSNYVRVTFGRSASGRFLIPLFDGKHLQTTDVDIHQGLDGVTATITINLPDGLILEPDINSSGLPPDNSAAGTRTA